MLKPFYYRTPLVIGLHGVDDWRKWYHIFLDRLTKSQCDMFVPNSNAVAERFMRKEKISRDKMVVIKNGTDTEKFDKGKFEKIDKKSLNLPSDKIIITTLASLRFEKGHEFYIQVIQRYLAQLQNVHFVWIGRGVLKPFLEKKLGSIGTLDQVTMINYAEDVRPILSCSDIFVLPSREEGMPRAMMEAMSMSLPCVATNVGGVGEVLEDGVSGFISDFGNVEAFGSSILDLVNNQDLRQKMGAAARERVAKNFNMEIITKKYMKFFELIAAGHRDGVEIQRQIDELAECPSW